MTNSACTRLGFWSFAILAALFLAPCPAAAQAVSSTFRVTCILNPALVNTLKPTTPNAGKKQAPKITDGGSCWNTIPVLHFHDEVNLAVEHAPDVTFDDKGEPSPADLVLFLDGKALPGTFAFVGPSQTDEKDVTTTMLTFRIDHHVSTDQGRANWRAILAAANGKERLTVSTGLENGAPAPSNAQVQFVPIQPGKLMWWFLLAAAGLVGFIWMAYKSNALRDGEPEAPEDDKSQGGQAPNAQPNPGGENEKKKKTRPAFSLARAQMALWTVLVVYAYLYIWLLTGSYQDTIPASIVPLMGISLTTFGVASAIDKGNVAKNQDKADEKKKDLAKANDKLTEAQKKLDAAKKKSVNPSADPDVQAGEKAQAQAQEDVTTLSKQLKELEARTVVCPASGTVVPDLVTSEEGTSLHRLQFALWTIALAAVFVVTVFKTYAMPDFNATLLGLMGLTSGTYAALKVPENKR